MIAPKPSAPRISQTVDNIPLMCRREERVDGLDPGRGDETGRHRRVDPLDVGQRLAQVRVAGETDDDRAG